MQKCKFRHRQKRPSITLDSASQLHVYVYENDHEGVQEILKSNFSKYILDVQDHKGRTPLYISACYRRHELAQMLLEAGCSTKVVQENGNTVLHEAVERNCSIMVSLLLKYDKDLLDIRNNKGETALFKAVYLDYVDEAKLLIKQGASLNICNNEGLTPLMCSINEGSERSASLLIQSGCDVNKKDQNGHSTLYILVNSKYIKKFDLILENLHESDYNFNEDSSWLASCKPETFYKHDNLYIKTMCAAGLPVCLPSTNKPT